MFNSLDFNGGTERLFSSKSLQYIHVHIFPQRNEIIFSTTISIFAAANYFYSPVAATAFKNWNTLPTIQALGHNWLLFSVTTANHICWWMHTSHWLANKAVMLHKLKRIHPPPKTLNHDIQFMMIQLLRLLTAAQKANSPNCIWPCHYFWHTFWSACCQK